MFFNWLEGGVRRVHREIQKNPRTAKLRTSEG
jgi:hypothetical protein